MAEGSGGRAPALHPDEYDRIVQSVYHKILTPTVPISLPPYMQAASSSSSSSSPPIHSSTAAPAARRGWRWDPVLQSDQTTALRQTSNAEGEGSRRHQAMYGIGTFAGGAQAGEGSASDVDETGRAHEEHGEAYRCNVQGEGHEGREGLEEGYDEEYGGGDGEDGRRGEEEGRERGDEEYAREDEEEEGYEQGDGEYGRRDEEEEECGQGEEEEHETEYGRGEGEGGRYEEEYAQGEEQYRGREGEEEVHQQGGEEYGRRDGEEVGYDQGDEEEYAQGVEQYGGEEEGLVQGEEGCKQGGGGEGCERGGGEEEGSVETQREEPCEGRGSREREEVFGGPDVRETCPGDDSQRGNNEGEEVHATEGARKEGASDGRVELASRGSRAVVALERIHAGLHALLTALHVADTALYEAYEEHQKARRALRKHKSLLQNAEQGIDLTSATLQEKTAEAERCRRVIQMKKKVDHQLKKAVTKAEATMSAHESIYNLLGNPSGRHPPAKAPPSKPFAAPRAGKGRETLRKPAAKQAKGAHAPPAKGARPVQSVDGMEESIYALVGGAGREGKRDTPFVHHTRPAGVPSSTARRKAEQPATDCDSDTERLAVLERDISAAQRTLADLEQGMAQAKENIAAAKRAAASRKAAAVACRQERERAEGEWRRFAGWEAPQCDPAPHVRRWVSDYASKCVGTVDTIISLLDEAEGGTASTEQLAKLRGLADFWLSDVGGSTRLEKEVEWVLRVSAAYEAPRNEFVASHSAAMGMWMDEGDEVGRAPVPVLARDLEHLLCWLCEDPVGDVLEASTGLWRDKDLRGVVDEGVEDFPSLLLLRALAAVEQHSAVYLPPVIRKPQSPL